MTGNETRGALTGLIGGVSELLKNKTVLEALIAGVGAFSAANKVKSKNGSQSGLADSFDFSGILDMLPQIMPLLGLLTQSDGGIFGTSGSSDGQAESLPAITDGDGEDGDALPDAAESMSVSADNISYGNKTENRENLLLALRPFLSESRAAAADAIIQVNRISGFLG